MYTTEPVRKREKSGGEILQTPLAANPVLFKKNVQSVVWSDHRVGAIGLENIIIRDKRLCVKITKFTEKKIVFDCKLQREALPLLII